MINFSDEWTIKQLSVSRQERFLDEAQQYRVMKQLRGRRTSGPTFRRSLGLRMIQLGEQILGVSPNAQTPYSPGRSAVS